MNTSSRIGVLLISMLSVLLTACDKEASVPSSSSSKMPPPPSVTVAKVLTKKISNWEKFTGRLEATKNVELRPRVSGYIEQVTFQEGEIVKKGDLLFKIDDRHFRIEVQRLKALLGSAQAQINLATLNVKRASSLKLTNAVSQENLDTRNTELVKANADYNNVKASLRSAKLDLSFTRVTAPISGKVSNAKITQGNFVAAGETVLTSLVSMESTYAYFDVNEQSYMKLRSQDINATPVLMQLVGETEFPHEGQVDFVDNQLDPTTGTVRLRAVFSNAARLFTPGMFVRLKMKVGSSFQAMLIDEAAIGTDLSHQFVLFLGENNIVEYRAITLGGRFEGLRVVLSGLSAGDVLVIKGLQRARPGSPVTPSEVGMLTRAPIDQKMTDQKSTGQKTDDQKIAVKG